MLSLTTLAKTRGLVFAMNRSHMKTLAKLTVASLPFLLACSGAPSDGAATTDEELRVCASGATVEGVDVSYFDPNIN